MRIAQHPSGASVRAVEGAGITVCDSGPDRASAPVVLLHGAGGSTMTDFWSLYPMLAGTRRTIGVDLSPEGDPSVEGLADRIAKAVVAVAGAPVHLVGYSLGAVLSAVASARHPDLCETLTLVNGWRRTDVHQRLRHSAWQRLLAEGSSAWSDVALASAHSALFLRSLAPYQLDDLRARHAARRDPRPELELSARIDITRELSQITTPTLIIGSTYDAMVPSHHSRELFGAIENARYLEIAAGHAVTAERPAEVFAAIDDFVSAPDSSLPGAVLPSFQA